MKCKNCKIEEILKKREAIAKQTKHNKQTKCLVTFIFLSIATLCYGIIAIEFCWFLAAYDSKPFVFAGTIIHFLLVTGLLIIFMSSYLSAAMPLKIKEWRKKKFTKKFPDDAKYLD